MGLGLSGWVVMAYFIGCFSKNGCSVPQHPNPALALSAGFGFLLFVISFFMLVRYHSRSNRLIPPSGATK